MVSKIDCCELLSNNFLMVPDILSERDLRFSPNKTVSSNGFFGGIAAAAGNCETDCEEVEEEVNDVDELEVVEDEDKGMEAEEDALEVSEEDKDNGAKEGDEI